jgi:hypothetical protein
VEYRDIAIPFGNGQRSPAANAILRQHMLSINK